MKKDGTDIHHILPVSIGGSDEGDNKIVVNRFKHGLYHLLFNNWHPSAVIRFFFLDILKEFFEVTIDIEREPFKSFLRDFDKRMNNLVDRNSPKVMIESKEKITQININFQNKKKKQKFEIKLKELLDIGKLEWKAELVFQKLIYWFKIDSSHEQIHQIIEEIRLKKIKGQ